MPVATNKPQPYAQSPQPDLKGSLQPYAESVNTNFSLIEASIRQIIAYAYSLADAIADLVGRVVNIEKEIIIIEDTLDGIVNAALFNRGPGNAEQLNSATILAAAASITGLPKTLYLKRGTWVIDADVDLSSMASSLLLAPGAVLEQIDLFTFKMPLNVTIPDQGIHFSAFSDFIIPKVGSQLRLDPRWWGALSTPNDTAALDAFEDASYRQGADMVMPAGDYGYRGTWTVRKPISGYGVKIIQIDSTKYGTNFDATIVANDVPGFKMVGDITIDSNNARPGIYGRLIDSYLLDGIKVTKCLSAGFYTDNCPNALISNCASSFIAYYSNPSTGEPADGFYHVSCEYPVYRNCYAFDFERIGFVSEGDPSPTGIKSKLAKYYNCKAEYAHDADISTSEFNAAFWAENTNGCDWIDCECANIATGIGQAERFTVGVQVGGGQNDVCEYNIVNLRVYDNTTSDFSLVAMQGVSVFGTSGYARVNIEDAEIKKCYQGVSIGGGIGSVFIDGLQLEGFINNDANTSGVIVNSDSYLQKLSISKVTEQNCTWNANGGTINFFAPAVSCQYYLSDCKGISHTMSSASGSVASSFVSGCEILYGATSRYAFTGPNTNFVNTILTQRVGGRASISDYSGSDPGCTTGTGVTVNFQPNAEWAIIGESHSVSFTTSRFLGGASLRFEITGSHNSRFMGNTFEYGSDGAIRANGSTPATGTGIFQIHGNDFSGPAVTPLQALSTDPTLAVIIGNTYPTGIAFITNWATTVEANNTPI